MEGRVNEVVELHASNSLSTSQRHYFDKIEDKLLLVD